MDIHESQTSLPFCGAQIHKERKEHAHHRALGSSNHFIAQYRRIIKHSLLLNLPPSLSEGSRNEGSNIRSVFALWWVKMTSPSHGHSPSHEDTVLFGSSGCSFAIFSTILFYQRTKILMGCDARLVQRGGKTLFRSKSNTVGPRMFPFKMIPCWRSELCDFSNCIPFFDKNPILNVTPSITSPFFVQEAL